MGCTAILGISSSVAVEEIVSIVIFYIDVFQEEITGGPKVTIDAIRVPFKINLSLLRNFIH